VNPSGAPAGGSRAHLLLFALLAGAWHASVAAMFVGFPVLVVGLLNAGGHPALVVWSAAMFGMLILSLRVRDRGEAPGRPLPREEAPRLHDLVEEARRAAGIGPVGEIRLSPHPTVGVTRVFRGGILYTRPVKVLVVGLPLFRALTVPELESILLHEFAHFLGQDVHRGERLATIEARLGNLRRAFDRTGPLRWLNPVYLWIRLYGGLFGLATASIRRRQEILADALAAETCGPIVYSRALLKAAALRRLFFRAASRRLLAAARADRPLPANLFLEAREAVRALAPEDRRRALREAREAPEPPRSTHPPLSERLERLGRSWVPRRRVREERAARLVPGLEAVERSMTPEASRLVLAVLLVQARRRGRAPAAVLPGPGARLPEPARVAASILPVSVIALG
jgi:Zn-dependent protease with chaperone function